jgi:hypothetical protein
MPVSIEDIANQMLALLPDDGTPVLNRVMRVMLSRELQASIDQDSYFKARDVLLDQGSVGVQRGQGGQIFLLPEKKKARRPTPDITESEKWTEASLMTPLEQYLRGPFQKGLDLPKGAEWVVQDTSATGDRLGRWARPDFILVSAMRFKLMPGAQLDVHSFELKAEFGATDLAVYEALAQTRFTHFGHLVWHLPEKSKAEARLAEIETQCDHHGVGLIRMRSPKDVESFEILLDPKRKGTMPATVEGFLEKRLDAAQRERLLAVTHGARP